MISRHRLCLSAGVVLGGLALGPSLAAQIPFANVVVDGAGPDDMHSKAAGDLNGDGFVDLVVASTSGEIYWYDDRSSPGSWTRHTVTTGGGGWSTDAEVGDMDGDGDMDLVVSDWYGQSRIVYFRNNGQGSSWTLVPIGSPKAHDIELADFDGDGDMDVVTREQGTQGRKIKFWRQDSPTSWSVSTFLPPSVPEGEGLRAADLDSDGDVDVVLPSYWLENTGSFPGGFVEHRFTSQFGSVDAIVAVGDINGDGRMDVALTPAEAAGQFGDPTAWFEAPAATTQGNWTRHIIESGIEHVTHALQLGDLDGDGDLDVVTAEMHQGVDPDEVRVYHNLGAGQNFQKQVIGTAGSHSVRLCDVGSDGDLDVFGANWEQSNRVDVWINGSGGGGGAISGFCDGQSGCPCSNNGSGGEGCLNSSGEGGKLAWTGSPSLSADNLVFQASDIISGEFAVLFSGDAFTNLPFGAGKRCVGGSLYRFDVRIASQGKAEWGPGLVSYAQSNFQMGGHPLVGSTWMYQVFYRDFASGCSFGLTNLTAGLRVTYGG